MLNRQGTAAEMLDDLRRATFEFFRREINPRNGLIPDKTQPGSPSSIAALGMGLSVYVVAVERDLLPRPEAADRTLTLLKFLHTSRQGPEPDATGYKGFYYHFLDMETGRRAWRCELSTIDTAILMAGVPTAACYFVGLPTFPIDPQASRFEEAQRVRTRRQFQSNLSRCEQESARLGVAVDLRLESGSNHSDD